MRIYTRSGDKGTTSMIYGERVQKNDQRVEAYGTCDEANAAIGLAISLIDHDLTWSEQEKAQFDQAIKSVQHLLFHVGSELATPSGKEVAWKLEASHVTALEKQMDQWQAQLPPIRQFILPGGHRCAAALHQARTIVRRAERMVVTIDEPLSPYVLVYLNRLSDYLFVAARYINHVSSANETLLETDK